MIKYIVVSILSVILGAIVSYFLSSGTAYLLNIIESKYLTFGIILFVITVIIFYCLLLFLFTHLPG